MLTPVEIQSKSFKSGGLGYDKKEVDAFMREVLKSYEDLYRQNMEQKDKIATLNEGIQYYKTIEKTLQKALLLAEKTAEETKLTARKEAKHIEKEAQTKASIMLSDARNELDSLHQQTIRLIQEYEKYKAQFKNLAAAQIELLNSDAFNINISRLDAFIDLNVDSSASSDAPAADDEAEEEETASVNISEDTASANDESFRDAGMSVRISAYENDDDRDIVNGLSDYEVDGQEEFDYLDLNDPES